MSKGCNKRSSDRPTGKRRRAGGELQGEIAKRRRVEDALRESEARLQATLTELEGVEARYRRIIRRLAAELSLTEERERQRIAADLHDNVVQNLCLCQVKLRVVQQALPSFEAPLEELLALNEESIGQVRSLVYELTPPMLQELGLVSAVEGLAERFQQKFGIHCEVRDDQRPKPLDHDVEIFVFQAVRELLQNVGKHARASRATVTLESTDEHIHLRVVDDGVGFTSSRVETGGDESTGFGLLNIRERLDLLGGRLDVQSFRDKGTRVVLLVPLKSHASDYVLKESAFGELAEAIQRVAAGGLYISPKLDSPVIRKHIRVDLKARTRPPPLTPREREVLQLLAEGKKTTEIAEQLYISVKTVETHRMRIMKKLDLHSVAQLTKYAVREGLTSLEH